MRRTSRLLVAFVFLLATAVLVLTAALLTQQSVLNDLQADLDRLKAAQHAPVDLTSLTRRVSALEASDWRMGDRVGSVYELYEQLTRPDADEWQCPLSYAELELTTRVVMAESGNQPYVGQMAVAQCILDRMTRDGQTLEEVVYAKHQFAAPYSGAVTDSVKAATEAVFCRGLRVCEEPIYYFYSTVGGFFSDMHERQHYVMTIDDHRFFN